ncbi:MAG: hypothetical protein CR993_04130 [Rhodobacterales bacterium]|nr:MAG: hypothetical protein CR993_04130 [Rhodobacterales bacterium]
MRSFLAMFLTLLALPVMAQGWGVVEEGERVRAEVCAGEICLGFGCIGAPLGFEVAGAEGEVSLAVDGRAAGVLRLENGRALFDPDLDAGLIRALRYGNRLRLTAPDQEPRDFRLTGSNRAISRALATCPRAAIPLTDPGRKVLAEITRDCAALGGEIGMEPGFVRYDDLDGDGVRDIVIDYAAAVCSRRPSLHCTAGGCRVGGYLARGEVYVPLFTEILRGYEVGAEGLTLDLEGTACGLYSFEACRKRYGIEGDALVLRELLSEEAEEAPAAEPEAEPEPEPETVAEPEPEAEPVAPPVTPATPAPRASGILEWRADDVVVDFAPAPEAAGQGF